MIDFRGQVVIVTGAGRGLGRLYALELARRRAAVVVNDVGGTMHGEGADETVALGVAHEIERAGGVAIASYDSVATGGGGEAIVRAALDSHLRPTRHRRLAPSQRRAPRLPGSDQRFGPKTG